MHDLGERHELALRVRPVGQVGDRALLDDLGHVGVPGHDGAKERTVVLHVVERRHVHARHLGELPQHALAGAGRATRGLPAADHLGHVADDLFAVADHEGVDEVGQRLRVERAVATGHDQWMLGAPLRGAHRHARQVDADELSRDAEADDVEVGGGAVGVDREKRYPPASHEPLHVDPGGIGALGERVGALVEDLVEDLEPLVGKAHLVGVRVHEEPGHLARRVGRYLGSVFAPDVPGRLLHLGQQRLDARPERRHQLAQKCS